MSGLGSAPTLDKIVEPPLSATRLATGDVKVLIAIVIPGTTFSPGETSVQLAQPLE